MSGFVLRHGVCWMRSGLWRCCGWGRFVGFFFGLAAGVHWGVVVVGFGADGGFAFGEGEGPGHAIFGGGSGVGLEVADGEGGLVLGDGLFAIGLDVVEAAEVDVRPGEGAGIF